MLRASAYPIEGILTFSGAELNPIFIIFSVLLIGFADTPVLKLARCRRNHVMHSNIHVHLCS